MWVAELQPMSSAGHHVEDIVLAHSQAVLPHEDIPDDAGASETYSVDKFFQDKSLVALEGGEHTIAQFVVQTVVASHQIHFPRAWYQFKGGLRRLPNPNTLTLVDFLKHYGAKYTLFPFPTVMEDAKAMTILNPADVDSPTKMSSTSAESLKFIPDVLKQKYPPDEWVYVLHATNNPHKVLLTNTLLNSPAGGGSGMFGEFVRNSFINRNLLTDACHTP